MNVERLTKLADFLETDPRPQTRFDINQWTSGPDLSDCGTTACAFGWATVVFPEHLCLGEKGAPRAVNGEEILHNIKMYEFAADFFDISVIESTLLFCPYYWKGVNGIAPEDVTAAMVAKAIRNLIAGRSVYDNILEPALAAADAASEGGGK